MRRLLHAFAVILCALSGTMMFLGALSYCKPLRADFYGQCGPNCVNASQIWFGNCAWAGMCHTVGQGVPKPCSQCSCGSTALYPRRPVCI